MGLASSAGATRHRELLGRTAFGIVKERDRFEFAAARVHEPGRVARFSRGAERVQPSRRRPRANESATELVPGMGRRGICGVLGRLRLHLLQPASVPAAHWSIGPRSIERAGGGQQRPTGGVRGVSPAARLVRVSARDRSSQYRRGGRRSRLPRCLPARLLARDPTTSLRDVSTYRLLGQKPCRERDADLATSLSAAATG
jgi:hypothetical protein